MKFLRGLFHVVEKITNPIRGLLAKLKILHQIFLIIGVMSIFLVLEGILSLTMLHNMQTITQKVFSVSAQSEQFVSSINHEVESIRKTYIVSLLDNSPNFLNTSTFEFAYTGLQSLHLASINPNVAIIGQRIELLKTLQNKPVSRENYEKLNQALTDITMEISTIERTIDSKVLETMNSGNQYSEGSRNIAIVILIVSLIISLIIGLLVASLIVKPIKAMVHVAGLLSQGNLTENLETKGNREVNQLVDGLNNAITNLRKLVSNITEQAEVLDTASKELDSASNESGRAASEVARAMEEMAKATAEQTDQINQSSTNVSELGQLVRQVSNDTKNITQTSEHVANSAKNGQKVTMDVAQNIDDLYETTKAVEIVIHEMSESSEKIREFASTISGIAEQTTLLALNAAIEAARAGEHGKGFSVVAKETGKLADQSKQASEMIGHLIANMISHSNQAVQVIQKGVAKVEAGKDLSSKATATFENIFKELEDTLNQIHSVAQSASQMEERNEQVINAVASVAAISEEAMASTQEISATIEGQSAGAEEVAALANNLTSIADSMKKSVATFKI